MPRRLSDAAFWYNSDGIFFNISAYDGIGTNLYGGAVWAVDNATYRGNGYLIRAQRMPYP